MKRVVITGMGCVSGLGADVRSTWINACERVCAIRRLQVAAKNQPALCFEGLAALTSDDAFTPLIERFDRKQIANVDRVASLAAVATLEALTDAGLAAGCPQLESAAILYGSASGGNATIEVGYQRLFGLQANTTHPLTIPRYMGSGPASHISMLFGIMGPAFAISSACSSSAHAIGEGVHMIRSGRAATVVVGGSDASITYGSLIGWRSLQATTNDACRPFSLGRSGTAIGDGAATLVLEDEEVARTRGAKIYAEIAGYGATSDAAHLTQPNASSAERAIRAAHRDAGIGMDEPLLISAHGTGTLINDSSEATALIAAYAKTLERCTVIATKSAHGHLLGASGALELILAVMALREGASPPILNFSAPDPACALPLALSLSRIDYRLAMSTSFAFGGLNCALLARLV